jgi:hypothetical protein
MGTSPSTVSLQSPSAASHSHFKSHSNVLCMYHKSQGVSIVWINGGLSQWYPDTPHFPLLTRKAVICLTRLRAALTLEERMMIAEMWVRECKRLGMKTVVHVSHMCLRTARDLARHAAKIGADSIGMCVWPFLQCVCVTSSAGTRRLRLKLRQTSPPSPSPSTLPRMTWSCHCTVNALARCICVTLCAGTTTTFLLSPVFSSTSATSSTTRNGTRCCRALQVRCRCYGCRCYPARQNSGSPLLPCETEQRVTAVYWKYPATKLILLFLTSASGVKYVSSNLDDFAKVQTVKGFDALWAVEPKLQAAHLKPSGYVLAEPYVAHLPRCFPVISRAGTTRPTSDRCRSSSIVETTRLQPPRRN